MKPDDFGLRGCNLRHVASCGATFFSCFASTYTEDPSGKGHNVPAEDDMEFHHLPLEGEGLAPWAELLMANDDYYR